MIQSLFTIIISLLIVTSCANNNSSETIISMNESSRPLEVLKDLALNKGDTNAYNELETAYLDFEHGSFYHYAKEMADKHNYPQAYYDTYIQLLKPTENPTRTISLDSCDAKARRTAIKYLKKGEKLGLKYAEKELGYLKDEGFIK